MTSDLDNIERQLPGKRNFESPPLHLWDPPLSGDIDIRIASDGQWYHEGGRIERESLVRLFASILRREDDGEYYLVTPVEKWRIAVDLHPLLVTDFESGERAGEPVLTATLNTGRAVVVDEQHALFPEPRVDNVAALRLDHGLSALCTRAAWYRLVDLAEEGGDGPRVCSAGAVFALAPD